MIWFSLLVPAVIAILTFLFLKRSVVWWEQILPVLACIIIVIIVRFSVRTGLTSDTEYWGSKVVSARYYEYWETWHHEICSYSCNCTTDKDGHESCQTCYKDCSYCDENSAYWMAYDNAGNSWRISKEYYEKLKQQWRASPRFVELNRSIDFSNGCGKDGNAYDIVWDGRIESSESAVTEHSYVNRVQASHSSFNMEKIKKKDARKLGLFEYPEFYDYYKQPVILGIDSIDKSGLYNHTMVQRKFEYMNADLGPSRKVKVFILLFKDQPISIVDKQTAFWDGGNKNELVICMSVTAQYTIDWVQAFSWTDKKRVIVDCREDIMNIKRLDFDQIYDVVNKTIVANFEHKSFKDFDYLKIEIPTWAIILTYILNIIATGLITYWAANNEFENDDEKDTLEDTIEKITHNG